jgi:tetratricopeptide (TPR) repeat protein
VPGDAGILMRVGVAARAAGEPEAARSALERALEVDPDRLAARVQLGWLGLEEGGWAEAAEHASSALEALPGYGDAALLLAEAERRRGRMAAAVGALVDLLEEDAYDLRALFRLGEVLLEADRPADAVTAFRRVLRFDPASARGWLRLGEALVAAGRPAEAAACWRRSGDTGVAGERHPEVTALLEAAVQRAPVLRSA